MRGRSGPRVLVVGGGVIGCAAARELAGSGAQVTLLEKERVGCEASAAAAGILCPQLEAEGPSALLDLGIDSLRLFPDLVASLRQETGIDSALEMTGTLCPDMTREDESVSNRLYRWQTETGLPVERISPREIAELEPGLGGHDLGGHFFPRGGRVDPIALTRGLALAARRRGAEIREGTPVTGLRMAGDRVIGVLLAGGEALEGDQVVLAGGAWTSSLLPDLEVRVFPVRGQIVVLEARRPPRRHVLVTPRVYLAPRMDGTVLIGSTLENVGFRKGVTPKALLRLIASALALDPSLEDSVLAGSWSGLRPGTTDGNPILGPVRPGLVIAAGHYRNGILLAPITAALTGELILRGKTNRTLDPFSPARSPIPSAPGEDA